MTTLSIGKFKKIIKEQDTNQRNQLINKQFSIENTVQVQLGNWIEDQINVFEFLLDNNNNKQITKLGDRMLAQMATLYLIKTYNDLADNEKTSKEFGIQIQQYYPSINQDVAKTIFDGLNESDDDNNIDSNTFDVFYKKLSRSNQLDAKEELKNFIKSTSKNKKEFQKNFNKALDHYIGGFTQQSRTDLKLKDGVKQKDRQQARLKDQEGKKLRAFQTGQIIGLNKELEKIDWAINANEAMINQIKRTQNDRSEQKQRLGTTHVNKYQPIAENTIKNENALIGEFQSEIIVGLEKKIATLDKIKNINLPKEEIENKAIIKSKPIIQTSIIPIKNQEIVKKDQNIRRG